MKKRTTWIGISMAVLGLATSLYWSKTHTKHAIPPLLNREGPISSTSEWLNTKKAIEGLQAQLRLKPTDYKAKLLLAMAYMQEARVTGEHPYYYPAALDLLDEVVDETAATDDLHFQALVAKSSVLLSLHHFDEALELGQQIVQINPHQAEIYGILCDAHVELGHYPQAIEAADKMASLKPNLTAYSRISYLREIHGDLEGAIEAMKWAVSAGLPGLEQTAWTRVTLGKLYEKKGDLANAELQYQRALDETPHYAFAIAGQARVKASQQHFDEAIALYKKAADIIPEFSFTEELASVYDIMGNPQKAKEVAQEVVPMLQEDAEAGHVVDLELANLYVKLLDNSEKALDYAQNELEKRPANIDVHKCLALIYYKLNNWNKANEHLAVANKTKRNDPELLLLSGLIHYKSGEKQRGTALIKQSLVANPYQQEALAMEAKQLLAKPLSHLQ